MKGCKIHDKGGEAILKWARSSPSLQMICMEQNNFLAKLKKELNKFSRAPPNTIVVT